MSVTILKSETFGEIPVRMAISCLKHFESRTGKNLLGGKVELTELTMGDLEVLFEFSFRKGLRIEKKKFEYTPEDIEDMFDEVYIEFLKEIPKFFKELSGMSKEVVEETNPELKQAIEETEKK